METKNIFCRELCTAAQTVLNSLIETNRIDFATEYAILFSSNCLITYDAETDQELSVCIRLYKRNGVTIDLNPQSRILIGYVNGKKEIELPVDADAMDFMAETILRFSIFKKERTTLCKVFQDKHTYTIDLNA